jgi:hypothetical protein
MSTKERKNYDQVEAELDRRGYSGIEKLVFWCIIALAGEGYCTAELKESMRKMGWEQLFKMATT